MKRITIALTLAAATLIPMQARAQETATTDVERELRGMVAEPTEADLDRKTVESFLDRDDVAEVAAEHGFDVERMKRGVETLDADASSDLAKRVADAQEEMAQVGGDTFVITSTTIIIALLIIILVIVA